MRTESRPEIRLNTDQKAPWVPPRGIRYVDRPGRKKPFMLEWRPTSKAPAKTVSFDNTEDREAAARDLAEKREEHGRTVMDFNPAGWREYVDAKEAAGGADLRIVVHEWKSGRTGSEETTNAHSRAVSVAVESYLKLRLAEDVRKDTDTWRHLELHLKRRFAGAFAKLQLHEVTTELLREWVNGLMNPDKPDTPMSNLTKRHHRKDVNTFFTRAVAEGWLKHNPCTLVKPPSFDDDEGATKDRVIPPEDLVKLFAKNADQPVIGRMALELFGGMRASSAERAVEANINFAEKGIEMPGQKHKSGKRKYRSGHPANLWAWLEHAGESAWSEVSEKNYDHLKGDAFIRADVRNPGNGLRHSFISYHLAAFQNPPLTQRLAQHTKSSTTDGYEGFATAAGAKIWLGILPPKRKPV